MMTHTWGGSRVCPGALEGVAPGGQGPSLQRILGGPDAPRTGAGLLHRPMVSTEDQRSLNILVSQMLAARDNSWHAG